MSSLPLAETEADTGPAAPPALVVGAGPVPGRSRRAWLLGVLPFALCFLYLLLPGHPLSPLDGLPLGPVELSLAVALAIVLYGFGRVLPRRLAGVLVVVAAILIVGKLLVWWAAPIYGLAASYYPRARVGGVPERSSEFRGVDSTRVEHGPARPDFALFFFNDVERFNFYEADQPDRAALPFAVRWDGFLHVPRDGEYPLELAANGIAALSLDGQPLLTVAAASGQATDRSTVALAGGAHPLRLEYIRPDGRAPSLRLAWDRGDGLRPIEAPDLTVDPLPPGALERDALVRAAGTVVDVALIVLLVTLCAGLIRARFIRSLAATPSPVAESASPTWERPLLALFLAVIFAHALATTTDLYRRPVILEGGQDWLTYESYARDILLNGPLMTLGRPLGQGKPFFFQPFYPYYLAALHWLTGEDLWGVTVLQLLGLGVAGVLLFWLARRLLGLTAAWATLGLFVVLQSSQLDWVARKLLSENLYFVLLPAAILLVVRFVDERRRTDLVLAGLCFGLATITRAPTLLYVPCAAALVALLLRRAGIPRRSALGSAALLLALTGAVAALVPLRNYVVSGRPALVATNGGATLLLAHTPTPQVRLARVDENRLYNLLRLDRPTREVLEFVRQDPLGYAATLVPLALYTVGFSGAVDGTSQVSPDILALTALYLASLVLLPAARSLRLCLLHLFVAIHFVMMVTFLPYVYGYRQVLPMNLLMLVFVGGLLAPAIGRLRDLRSPAGVSEPPLAEQRSG